jgi:2-succinyl-5-enolpyruvyl-6-hydroxy-3-cyclohexene-1-carboxylate synthase
VDRPITLREVEAPRILRQVHEGGKVVSPMHQLPLPPGDTPGSHFS